MREYIDYYKLLGLKPTATLPEIKQAYHFFARQFHPDFYHEKESEEKAKRIFQDISEAYFILSDPKLRKEFDRKNYHHPSVARTPTSRGMSESATKEGKGYRRLISTPYPILNVLINLIELGVMLVILAAPFLAPFILIFVVLMAFRY
ncbi:MAG TPA: DnaJ domain-containing protein [Nitrospiria bacterium]|nr:DnaJ domain-containing protein [Nitrospiria bacterium]